MQFGAEDYYRAGVERMRQAKTAYQEGRSYALAMYCGGLAVESLLRAFRWKENQTFEARHDLTELLKASRLMAVNEGHLREKKVSDDEIRRTSVEIRTAMNEVAILWHNNLRFASESKLRAFLNQIGRLQRTKGDALKKNAFDLIDAAGIIVDRGIVLWTSKTRS